MTLGRVRWFGGLNKKTGQVNNFGFLDTIDTKYQNGIYISRKTVPSHIQPLLDTGTYVEFDVNENEQGEKYASNIEMVLLVGTIEWFDSGRGYIKCDNHEDIRVESLEEFEPNTILSFYVRYNSRFKRNEALLPQRVDYWTQDKMLIELCAKSDQPKICVPFVSKYANLLTRELAVNFVKTKIDALQLEEQQSVLCNLAQYSEKLLLSSVELRQKLVTDGANRQSFSSYWQFIDSNIISSNNSINKELLDEVKDILTSADEKMRSSCWRQSSFLKDSLEYKGELWDFAPVEAKANVVRQRYSDFFDLSLKFKESGYAFSDSTSCSWQELYELDDIDKRLVHIWCSDASHPLSEETRMTSARGAEKLAISFFDELGHQVEDVAAHQINQKSDIWRQADIQIDKQYLLDVKNARNAVNSKSYSEFCVPKFKQNRDSKSIRSDVFIVAVLSPYLQSRYIVSNSIPNFHVDNPRVLGVFSAAQLEHLEKAFSDSTLSIDLSRGLDPKRYLPPWLFDYSARFYEKQNKIKREFLQIKDSDLPGWTDLWSVGEFPLSLFISARRPIPESWTDQLPSWQADFIALFLSSIQSKNVSLPYLFLSILKHFLMMLSSEDTSYSPQKYNSLVYADRRHPLKLYDPLNIISDFCEALECLWTSRKEANLTKFRIFSFNGRGMLKGKQSHNDSWTTLLAYCGGYIEGKGKCGYTPLVIGQHRNCTTCGHLICPKDDCQHCSRGCPRQDEMYNLNEF